MKILLSVCGSISAYKSLDIARGLINNGHQVKVVLTRGALKFVVPEVFTYLGVSDVYLDDDDFKHKNVLHVDLARWCETLVIAPLSANTLSRLAQGSASDLLSSVFLALEPEKTIAVFPAMNSLMLKHPFTQENLSELKKLKTLNNVFISPTNSGILACNEIGEGKLPSVEEIIELIPTLKGPFGVDKTTKKKVVITTGATIAPLDPVRYLTNSSSGITGFHLGITALKHGHEVVMIAGKNACAQLNLLIKHPDYKLIRVTTVNEMHDIVHSELGNASAYISAAAISDIEFDVSFDKIKKESISDSLKVKKATDILKTVIAAKIPNLKIVGFAAETNLSEEVLTKKFDSKPVDLLIGTKVNNGLISNSELQGFNVDNADYRFMEKGLVTLSRALSKSELAEIIFQRIKL
ncbi:MAG: bifunctional phosphopantothenoylcysteine decarboxylase/phosphopantothenate--cysteine ligase CoaBC [Alphaproteobacteria bacterium]|nr:MAG: bifunctional phosphopantothenoylcysteine decarboxylase/phosphopantothenate--cysteine ligase CoaBC [Alphaproteobacteria bacterium]